MDLLDAAAVFGIALMAYGLYRASPTAAFILIGTVIFLVAMLAAHGGTSSGDSK